MRVTSTVSFVYFSLFLLFVICRYKCHKMHQTKLFEILGGFQVWYRIVVNMLPSYDEIYIDT